MVSLATTAAVHFGDVADPESGEKQTANFDAAGHAIEMLALLEEKGVPLTPEQKAKLGIDE